MSLVSLSVAFPIAVPFLPEEGRLRAHAALVECLRTKTTTLNLYGDLLGGTQVKLQVLDTPTEYLPFKSIWNSNNNRLTLRRFSALLMTADVDLHQPAIERLLNEVDANLAQHREEFRRVIVTSEFTRNAHDILLALTIAQPGALRVTEGHVFIAEAPVGPAKGFMTDYIWSAAETASELGWPTLCELSIEETWAWLVKVPGMEKGVPSTSLGRALAALTYIADDSGDASLMQLVWALLGLEALYGKGNVGLREQLVGKTEAFLGPRLENKKQFGAMYDFRSRLIHGDIDIPLAYSPYDGIPEYDGFHQELFKSQDVAIATLIASLQKMISNKWYMLDFRYEPSGSP